ncbi:MAG: hypothetical protein IKE89_02940 [Bacilli bacterium]|nr:hypothetical protein [Bacilli bacterium]
MEYDLIDKDNYDNYIDEVVNISKTSTEKMSILYNYQFNEDVYNDITIIDRNGNNRSYKYKFIIDDELFILLNRLVKEFYDNNEVNVVDIIDLNKDNKYTFRMITKFNDLFSVNDISYNRAIELKNNI